MREKIKHSLIIFGIILFAVLVNWCAFTYRESIASYPMTQTDYKEMQEHQIEIYKLIARQNEQIGQVHTDYLRVGHYISGHDFHHPTDFCPQCGLLQVLDKRGDELNTLVINLSEENAEMAVSGLKDSPKYKENVETMNKAIVEQEKIKSHLFSEDGRAVEVNKIMRKHRLIGGKFQSGEGSK